MDYNVDYFIRKFEVIPEGNWSTGSYGCGSFRCALGHCIYDDFGTNENKIMYGHIYGAEYVALLKLFNDGMENPDHCNVAKINDGKHDNYSQPTPKQRILAALYDIKKMQEPKVPEQPKIKEKTVYVTVSESLKENIPQEQFN